MDATASDPGVQQQFGMIVGIPNAGQVNALATPNIRGERSATCRGDFDRHPSEGPLPPGRHPSANSFAGCPMRSSARPSSTPPTDATPILPRCRCSASCSRSRTRSIPRTCDPPAAAMRATTSIFRPRSHAGGAAPQKGAIIFAKAVNTEYNGRAGDPGGRHKPDGVLPSTLGYQRSTWGGNPANPYDTTRSARSVELGIGRGGQHQPRDGEPRRRNARSCRGPSNHNAVALILPHKSMLGFDGGAIGADIYCDRSGIHCRTIGDCAKVLDALKDPVEGYYDPRDPYTTVPRSSVLSTPYASHATTTAEPGALAGTRLGVIRESMLIPPGSKTEEPIVTAAAKEIKVILGNRLGATLVESSDPLWTRDPDVELMKTDFRRALARLVPVFMPDLLFRLGRDGQPVFRDFAAAITPTEFMPGKVFGTGTMKPIDYCVEMAEAGSRASEPRPRATVSSRRWRWRSGSIFAVIPHSRAIESARLYRDAHGFRRAQCGPGFWGDDQRRCLQELGGGGRPAQSAGRPPGRR